MQFIIKKLLAKQNLNHLEIWEIFGSMLKGNLSEAQIAGFLVSLKAKGETIEEIYTATQVLKNFANTIEINDKEAIDTCGVGGADKKTFNVSTAISFVLSAGNVTVAKHGNRSNSSLSGSSDVLEALGVNIQLSPELMQQKINEGKIGFLFAPLYHTAMKYVATTRKELGVSTIFNLLGPLLNPANVQRQLVGVNNDNLVETYIYVLDRMAHKKAIVVCGEGGFDEFSLCGKSNYATLDQGRINFHHISPVDVGLNVCNYEEVKGGNPADNAKNIELILQGKLAGPKTDLVAFNAGAGFWVADKVHNLKDGVALALEIIKSGKAYEKLEYLRR